MAVNVILIERIELPAPGIEQMQEEARAEGYEFLEPLVDEWVKGENRFDAVGEILLGHSEDGMLLAIGGLNIDPYLRDAGVGRIRRLYVRRAWRNRGVGGALVECLLAHARQSFSCVRLRAESARAARLYERIGFVPAFDESATHAFHF